MISAGLLIKGNACRIVTLSGSKQNYSRIAEKFHKLELAAKPSQEDVEVFVQTIKAFCSDNNIDLININFRNTKGEHAGGAASFRIEGIILASAPISVQQIHQATIGATNRKQGDLKTLKPKAKDIGRAFDLAFEGLE